MTIEHALAIIHAGRFEEGLAALAGLTRDPAARLEALGHRAWLYRSLGRLTESLSDYDALTRENPADLHGAAMRADTLRAAGRPREALQAAAAILALDPAQTDAAQVLLDCRQALGLDPVRTAAAYRFPAGGLAPRAAAPPVSRFPLLRLLRGKLRFPSRYDYYEHYLKTHAAGKRLIDIGAMWLVNGRFSFFAEQCGAAEVVAYDATPATDAFRQEHQKRDSKVKFIQGDLMDADALARLGSFDVVFCCGVLYHLADPLLGLQRIRDLTARQALIGTATIGEGFSRNRAVYYPYLDPLSRWYWNYRTRENKVALDCPYDPAADYVNWTWGLAPSCVAALAQTVGFRVVDIHYRWKFSYFECEVS